MPAAVMRAAAREESESLHEQPTTSPKSVIRDSHAEVLARRAFRLFLARELELGEASTVLAPPDDDALVEGVRLVCAYDNR